MHQGGGFMVSGFLRFKTLLLENAITIKKERKSLKNASIGIQPQKPQNNHLLFSLSLFCYLKNHKTRHKAGSAG